MTGRMTDEEIREVVGRIRASDAEKAALLKRALRGEPEARFAVAAKRLAQEREAMERLEPKTGGDHA